MPYTVQQLSRLTGLTPRTLRYYDALGLLCPVRDAANDYRRYGPAEVERLRQILLYREMGVPLEEIGRLLDDPSCDRAGTLGEHLQRLKDQRLRLENLIHVVEQTLAEWKGEHSMTDREKFEGLKSQILRENEAVYGREIREKYGEAAVAASNAKIQGMSQEEWECMQEEERAYLAALGRAMAADDSAGEDARRACRLHRQWLGHTWKQPCTTQAQLALVEMYTQDDRFRAYYDRQVAPGCADFFLRVARACLSE